jgi:hypothetical protein
MAKLTTESVKKYLVDSCRNGDWEDNLPDAPCSLTFNEEYWHDDGKYVIHSYKDYDNLYGPAFEGDFDTELAIQRDGWLGEVIPKDNTTYNIRVFTWSDNWIPEDVMNEFYDNGGEPNGGMTVEVFSDATDENIVFMNCHGC